LGRARGINNQSLTMTLLKKIFTDVGGPLFMRVNNFLAAITLISILSLALETVQSLESYIYVFNIIEWSTVAIFSLEYIGRIITAKHKFKYIFSFYGLVDLMAIIPTYLGLTNLTFLKAARITRILRFLRMVRLVKMMRVRPGGTKENNHKEVQNLSIKIYFVSMFASVLIFGTLIYLIEGDNPAFASIPLGMLWAMKLTLGGIAQTAYVDTIWGELVIVGVRFVGLLLFGLVVSIVGKFLKRMLLGGKEVGEK